MTVIGLLHRLAVRTPLKFTPTTATVSPPLSPTVHTTFGPSATMSAASTAASPLDAVFKQKKALRSQVKRELRSMDPTLRSQEDDAIQRIVLEAPWFKSCRRLCAYISCGALREVDTAKVLSAILRNTGEDDRSQVRKKLYVPRVEDKNSFMRMLNISGMDDLIANSMDILEPAPCDSEGNEREDALFTFMTKYVFIITGLAFDKSGRRLGRGGGYYDTFLTKYQELAKDRQWKKPLFVALSYSRQILEDGVIPITPNDVPVDALVLSSGVIPISPAAREVCNP
ncbi:5-formyltetrahydrofolate cyclo-ligase-mitochondrial [Striga hermonthica]|uniref:5-formyltetrahydrofolate cyclo-ligase n=1 Tax=Striga hermonthica TaxID=68872 RepID=A0A9N7RBX5_STRHE|nr:5-formyltetrahydrofolate cyclo-ligase-mitochondrial [Striga hermonthica]